MEVHTIMRSDVYAEIPTLENDHFTLRAINTKRDITDLLKVYSDEKAVPLFNSDNCNGDNFYYQSMEQMQKVIEFWEFSYENKYFVRWAIQDRYTNEVIGTIELFHRLADDFLNHCGLLRLDLRSDYETKDHIESILSIIIPEVKELFQCNKIATKAIPIALNRIYVLEKIGFQLSEDFLIGHDGTKYNSYYVMEV